MAPIPEGPETVTTAFAPRASLVRARKDMLSKQLTMVEGKINEALAARRAYLLEAPDLDAPYESPVIERLRDERAAVLTALDTIAERIPFARRVTASARAKAFWGETFSSPLKAFACLRTPTTAEE